MEKEQLEQYKSKKDEMKELENRASKESLHKLETECSEVEKFIESIEDSQLRRIFRMRYVDRLNLFTIGNKVYLDKSTVSRKISSYLNIARNATNG